LSPYACHFLGEPDTYTILFKIPRATRFVTIKKKVKATAKWWLLCFSGPLLDGFLISISRVANWMGWGDFGRVLAGGSPFFGRG